MSCQSYMPFCQVCSNEVQANWASCPFCSNSLSMAIPQQNFQQPTVEQMLTIQFVSKRSFPTAKLTVIFYDPLYGVAEQISFGTMARTYTAKLANGMQIGKLPLQGLTVFSGAKGMIAFPNGTKYNAELMTGPLGPKGLTITDWSDGRQCMITF